MAAVLNGVKICAFVHIVLVSVLSISTVMCLGAGASQVMETKEKANELVQSYSKRFGANNTRLNEKNDVSFGEYGFHHDPDRGILTGRVYVMKLRSRLFSPEEVVKAKKAMLELNSSRITPLFERAGGYFAFDENEDMLFLKKDFPVDSTTSRTLREQMDELADVAAKWAFRWYRWSMAIIYGQAQPPHPPLPVTRQNDAQHDEYKR